MPVRLCFALQLAQSALGQLGFDVGGKAPTSSSLRITGGKVEVEGTFPPDPEEATLDRHVFSEAATPKDAKGAGGSAETRMYLTLVASCRRQVFMLKKPA